MSRGEEWKLLPAGADETKTLPLMTLI